MKITFYVNEFYRRQFFVEGYELKSFIEMEVTANDLTKEQRQFLLDLRLKQSPEPPVKAFDLSDFILCLPYYDQHKNKVVADDNFVWSGKVNPNTMSPKQILDAWMTDYEKELESAEKEFNKH